MNKDISDKWVQYLSGPTVKYKAIARMRTGRARCPLGHLCDLYTIETGKGYWEQDSLSPDKWYFVDAQGNRGFLFLPIGVSGWARLEDPDFRREKIRDNVQERLAHVSDVSRGWDKTKRHIEYLGKLEH